MARIITRLCPVFTTTCFVRKTQAVAKDGTASGEIIMIARLKSLAPIGYCLIVAAVFLDSLRFKFTNAPETQTIFGKLDAWAASLGAAGLFSQTGLFSQYVVGAAELAAALLLVASLAPRLKRLRVIGALIAAAVMTGAVSFHLFTPLGIDPNADGGGLFGMAVVVWLSSLAMLAAGRHTLIDLARAITGALVQTQPDPVPPAGQRAGLHPPLA